MGHKEHHYQSTMQTEIFQAEGKRVVPETRFTGFPPLFTYLRVGISRSASETDVWLFILPMILKIIFIIRYCFYFLFLFFFFFLSFYVT